MFEGEDVLDLGPTPAVYGLVDVAYCANMALGPYQELKHLALHIVGVLVLVDVDVAPAAVVLVASLGIVAQEKHRFKQQVIEVERLVKLKRFFIQWPYLRDELFAKARCTACVFAKRNTLPFGARDHAQYCARLELAVEVLECCFDLAQRVRSVVYGWCALVPHRAKVLFDDEEPKRVKGRDEWRPPHLIGRQRRVFFQDGHHALAHLAGCLIGKGYGKDMLGRGTSAHYLAYAVRYDAGLPRSSPGKYQKRPIGGVHCFLLGRIKTRHPYTLSHLYQKRKNGDHLALMIAVLSPEKCHAPTFNVD
jgi:hypothetical protein